jgi:MFS transporter, PAT family, beta-lactamase induction signal transducer AmpG
LQTERRYLPPPLWAILALPFGLAVGYAQVAVPFVLRGRGVEMTVIASVSNLAQLPHIFKLLWSPVLDSGPRRRSWFYFSVALTSLALAAAALVPPSESEHLGPVTLLWVFTAVLFVGQAAAATSLTAVLALMAVTLPDGVRGRASGWQTAGNLAGTAAGGAVIAWMLAHVSATTTAIVLAVVCLACAVPAAFVEEAPLPRRSALRLVADLAKDVWQTLRSRDGWTGMLICLSPVGSGALTGLFSALAKDYARDEAGVEHLVIVVTGLLAGIVNAAGSLLGGYLSDRMNRRFAYVVFGGVTALSAVAMILAPATPGAFAVGCLAYTFANGLCYAAFYAFVLELVGQRGGVGTQLALYAGASNLATTYVTWFDGASYDWAAKLAPTSAWAPRAGMLGTDALMSFAGIGLLAAMLAYVRRARAREASSPARA